METRSDHQKDEWNEVFGPLYLDVGNAMGNFVSTDNLGYNWYRSEEWPRINTWIVAASIPQHTHLIRDFYSPLPGLFLLLFLSRLLFKSECVAIVVRPAMKVSARRRRSFRGIGPEVTNSPRNIVLEMIEWVRSVSRTKPDKRRSFSPSAATTVRNTA